MKSLAFLKTQKPPLKLTFLVILVLAITIFTLFLGFLLSVALFEPDLMTNLAKMNDLGSEEGISIAKYFQITSQLGMFVFPSLLFAYLSSDSMSKYLCFKCKGTALIIILSCISMISAIPMINWLADWNSRMHLPSFLSGIEEWMKSSEASAERITEVFLSVSTWSGLTVNIVMIAVLPAIGEELLFRGVVQRIIGEWTKNSHLAIFISALIFSAFHLQFYGFIPRLMMGMYLGYLFYWSKSLWVPIAAHFANNLFAVIYTFLTQRGLSLGHLDKTGIYPGEMVYVILSVIIFGGLAFIIYRNSARKNRNRELISSQY